MQTMTAVSLCAVTCVLLGVGSPAAANTPPIYCERAPVFQFNFCIATNASEHTSAGLGNPHADWIGFSNGVKMRVELVFRGVGVPVGQEHIVSRGPDIDGIGSGGTTRTGQVAWWEEGTFCARMYLSTHWWMDWACIYNYRGGWRPEPGANHISAPLIGVPG
jgi:hypothetical protein